MTCVELQESLVEIEDGTSAAQLAHLRGCGECTALVKELLVIASSAAELREAADPSPRVWNSIEIALRQEGLIHAPRSTTPLSPSFGRWAWARWLAPVAALLLIAAGLWVRHSSRTTELAKTMVPTLQANSSDPEIAGMNDGLKDEDLQQEIASLSPAMQQQYTDNLQRANEYIHDARSVVDQNPNDPEARRSLLEAYQQKAMLFELAMDRSLP
jgi:hypothetical protein